MPPAIPSTSRDAVAVIKPHSLPRPLAVALLLLLFAVGAKLRFDHVNDVVSRSPDERWYALYAGRIAEKGFGEFPVLTREYVGDPERYIYPPPLRVGYLGPLAEIARATGTTEMQAGIWFSLIASLATLAMVGVMGARYLPFEAALGAMLCLAVSIPDLVIARRTWADALMSALGMVLAWAAWQITKEPRRWWNYAVFALVGALLCLAKESGLFPFAACALYVAVFLVRRKSWRALAALTLAGLAAGMVCLGVLTLAAGGPSNLLAAWHAESLGFGTNSYGQVYQTGPAYRLLWGFWILGPVKLLLGAFAVSLSVLPDRWLALLSVTLRPPEQGMVRLFSWMTVVMVFMVLVLPIAQNFRYLSPIFGPICLLSGFGLRALLDLAARKLPGRAYWAVVGAVAAVVVAIAIADYRSFEGTYVAAEVPDLAIKSVLDFGR